MAGVRVSMGASGASYSVLYFAVPVREQPVMSLRRLPLSVQDLASLVLLMDASSGTLLLRSAIASLAACLDAVPFQLTVRPAIVRTFLQRLLSTRGGYFEDVLLDDGALSAYELPSGRLLATLLSLQHGLTGADLPVSERALGMCALL